MSNTLICFVRHAETTYNKEGYIQGWLDSKLTEEGIELATNAGINLSDVHFDVAYTSDLSRASDTAKLILKANKSLSINDLQDKKCLRELDFGANSGANAPLMQEILSSKEDQNKAPIENVKTYFDNNKAYDPTGVAEDYKEFLTRIHNCLLDICKKHPNQTVLVVGHSTYFRLFMDYNFPKEEYYPPMQNVGLSKILYKDNTWHLVSFDENITTIKQ